MKRLALFSLLLSLATSPASAQLDPGSPPPAARPEVVRAVEQALLVIEGEPPAEVFAHLGAEGRTALLAIVSSAERSRGLRRRAVLALRHYPDAAVRAVLEARAADAGEDAILSRYALRTLAAAFGAEAFDAIARRLDDPRAVVREGAVLALAAIDRGRAAVVVARYVDVEPERFVREAMRALR